ncbi:MAG: nitrous oxide reductase accessory protein NosL [Magnetococcales bacterium]|nr:nitrous oxide reductase accessory protein NosL [Magnetococcales bacterium]
MAWLVVLLVWLTACSLPPDPIPGPREPGRDSVGYYCGMTLAEHAGPKGQIHVAGTHNPLWFSSVRDTFVYLQTESTARRILAVYVNDMGHAEWDHPPPGTWIAAQKAWFVTGSPQRGSMGEQEIIPFGERPLAEQFAQQHGGAVVSYSTVLKEALSTSGIDPGGQR